MNLVKTTSYNGKFVEDTICYVGKGVLSSIINLRQFLQTYAVREIGGREERDWRINVNDKCLVPLYVSSNDGTITLNIK